MYSQYCSLFDCNTNFIFKQFWNFIIGKNILWRGECLTPYSLWCLHDPWTLNQRISRWLVTEHIWEIVTLNVHSCTLFRYVSPSCYRIWSLCQVLLVKVSVLYLDFMDACFWVVWSFSVEVFSLLLLGRKMSLLVDLWRVASHRPLVRQQGIRFELGINSSVTELYGAILKSSCSSYSQLLQKPLFWLFLSIGLLGSLLRIPLTHLLQKALKTLRYCYQKLQLKRTKIWIFLQTLTHPLTLQRNSLWHPLFLSSSYIPP